MGLGNSWYSKTQLFENVALVCLTVGMAIALYKKKGNINVSSGQFAIIVLTVFFTLVFWGNANPYPTFFGKNTVMPEFWWHEFSMAMILAAFSGFLVSFEMEAVIAVGAFCLMTSIFSSTCVLYSYLTHQICDESWSVVNPFAGSIARAGVCNLIVYFPVFWALWIFSSKKQMIPRDIVILIIAYGFCSFESFICRERVVFVILFGVVPVLLILHRLIISDRFSIKSLITGVLIISATSVVTIYIFNLIGRPVNLFKDSRFSFQLTFINELLQHPFTNATLLESQQKKWLVWWFHNFFADVHRSSGFVAFLLSVCLSLYIGISLCVSTVKKRIKPIFFLLYIAMILIMCQSVVPEGEFQPIVLTVMLGSLSISLTSKFGETLSSCER